MNVTPAEPESRLNRGVGTSSANFSFPETCSALRRHIQAGMPGKLSELEEYARTLEMHSQQIAEIRAGCTRDEQPAVLNDQHSPSHLLEKLAGLQSPMQACFRGLSVNFPQSAFDTLVSALTQAKAGLHGSPPPDPARSVALAEALDASCAAVRELLNHEKLAQKGETTSLYELYEGKYKGNGDAGVVRKILNSATTQLGRVLTQLSSLGTNGLVLWNIRSHLKNTSVAAVALSKERESEGLDSDGIWSGVS